MDKRLKILCDLYDRSDENIDTETLLKICFFKNWYEILKSVSHLCCVKFLYLYSKSILHLFSDGADKDVLKNCLDYVRLWLESPNMIDNEILTTCYNTAYSIYVYSPKNIKGDIFVPKAICSSIISIITLKNNDYYPYNLLSEKTKFEHLGILVNLIKEEYEP